MLREGDRVTVIHPRIYPENLLLEGTVVSASGKSKVGVRIDKKYNRKSAKGIYWYYMSDLEVHPEKITEMLCIAAKVSFLNSPGFNNPHSYALYDKNIKVGDMVAVKTGSHGCAVGRIEVIEKSIVTNKREVIGKVDSFSYDERNARKERAEELKTTMRERYKELEEAFLYDILAEKDAEFKRLYSEYKDLIKGDQL